MIQNYDSAKGYRYNVAKTAGLRKEKKKFDFGEFLGAAAFGGIVGGVTSAAFYGTGKGIAKRKDSFWAGKGGSRHGYSVDSSMFPDDEAAGMLEIRGGKIYMIQPDKVRAEAKKKENENFKFRTYLKGHADEDELDRQFLRLHKELFADYDCSKCRNCCKMYKGSIPAEDIDKDAQYLGITLELFVDVYLEKEEYGVNYQTKHEPCDFLQEDGNCKLGDCKPDSCKKYPYTDQPERLSSLLSVLDVIEICPVAFEIFERLKKEYEFRMRR